MPGLICDAIFHLLIRKGMHFRDGFRNSDTLMMANSQISIKLSVVYFRYLEILSRGKIPKIILCLFFAEGSVFSVFCSKLSIFVANSSTSS